MEILTVTETIPAAYPTAGHDALWQRIESYCAHRWTPRTVVYTMTGGGEFHAPLRPFEATSVEIWAAMAWQATAVDPTPLGGLKLARHEMYRITGTVGADNAAPAIVLEAFERLRAYLAADRGGVSGATSYSVNIGGDLSESFRRNPAHVAKALQNSGAADLLRSFRRA